MREQTQTRTAIVADKTTDMELAAALTTLGFECRGMQRIKNPDIPGSGEVCYWTFDTVSADGSYTLEQVLAAWQNDAWLTDPGNNDPLAAIIVAFRNRQRLLDWVKQSAPMVAVKAGSRWAFVPENAPAGHVSRAKAFLQGH
ncbi:MAG: hypothetical protein IJA81_09150 [Akkermansia sp.]|nr:hypothetical protein [Akkermansia sp.]